MEVKGNYRKHTMEGKGSYRKQWSESGRLDVIQAVMKVEDAIMREVGKPLSRHFKGGTLRKWERVNNQLPRHLRERKRKGRKFKFECLFGGLLREYRDMTVQTRKKGPCRYILTEAVCDILEKREAIWNAWTSNGRSPTVETSQDSASYQPQLPAATSNSSLSARSDQVSTSEGWSMQLETSSKQPATVKLSKHTGERGRNQEAQRFSSNTDDVEIRDASPGSSLGCEPRSLSAYLGPGHPTHCSLQSISNSVSESKDAEEGTAQEVVKAAARPGVQARAANRNTQRHWSSSTRSPSNSPRASSRPRRRTTSVTHPCSAEHLDAIMNGPQKTIDLEFSRLRSWVRDALIPVGRQDMNDSFKRSAAISSSKRSRSSIRMATEASDNLIYGGLSRKIDFRIQASFQKVRVRFANELKNISVEVARDVADVIQQDTNSECSDPEYLRGVMWGPRPTALRSKTPHMRCDRQETMRKRPYSRR